MVGGKEKFDRGKEKFDSSISVLGHCNLVFEIPAGRACCSFNLTGELSFQKPQIQKWPTVANQHGSPQFVYDPARIKGSCVHFI